MQTKQIRLRFAGEGLRIHLWFVLKYDRHCQKVNCTRSVCLHAGVRISTRTRRADLPGLPWQQATRMHMSRRYDVTIIQARFFSANLWMKNHEFVYYCMMTESKEDESIALH